MARREQHGFFSSWVPMDSLSVRGLAPCNCPSLTAHRREHGRRSTVEFRLWLARTATTAIRNARHFARSFLDLRTSGRACKSSRPIALASPAVSARLLARSPDQYEPLPGTEDSDSSRVLSTTRPPFELPLPETAALLPASPPPSLIVVASSFETHSTRIVSVCSAEPRPFAR